MINWQNRYRWHLSEVDFLFSSMKLVVLVYKSKNEFLWQDKPELLN